jgi:hypothetical protein
VHRAVAVDQLVLAVIRLAGDAVQALVPTQIDVVAAVVVDGLEEPGDRGLVPGFGGPDVVVVGDVQELPGLPPPGLHPVDELLRLEPLLPGGLGHLLAVLVGAGQEEDLLSPEPVVSGHEIGGHRGVGMADVRHVVRVVDGRGYVERILHRGSYPPTERRTVRPE